MASPHLPHLPHPGRLPNVDLRSVRHEALIAAEVALAAVVLTALVRGRVFGRDVATSAVTLPGDAPVTTPMNAPAAGAIANSVPSVSVSVDSTGTVVHVSVPTGGTSRITVTDAANVTVATLPVGQATTRIADLPAGEYRVGVSNEGPVEVVGDVAISSATSARTPTIAIAAGDVLTVIQDLAN